MAQFGQGVFHNDLLGQTLLSSDESATPTPDPGGGEEGGDLLGTVGVVGICALAMAVGTGAMLVVKIPRKVEAATQNFSAGILIAAIAGELFPLLHAAGHEEHRRSGTGGESGGEDVQMEKTLGMFIGFILGLVLMFGQKALLHHGGDEHGEGGSAEEKPIPITEVESVLPTPSHANRQRMEGSVPLLLRGRSLREQTAIRRIAGRAPSSRDVHNAPLAEADGLAPDESEVSVEAVAIVKEMKELSAKIFAIIADGADATSRDELDDEMSELHMLVGVLRRQVRGAVPLTEAQHEELQTRMVTIDKAVDRLDTHLAGSDISIEKTDKVLGAIENELQRIISTHIDNVKVFRRWNAVRTDHSATKSEIIPWSLVLGVSIDCLVDGLMVGLTYKVSTRAGYIMAFASSIESAFLGLSLSSSVYNATASRAKHLLISFIPIVTLQIGGITAALNGDALKDNVAAFAGFLMFAIVALLFLVTQELLLTAHSITDQETLWYVNVNLFFGSGMVIFLEQFLG